MNERIAVWPDGHWCEIGEISAMLQWKSDDYEIIEVTAWDDHGEPILPTRFAQHNWE